MKYLRNIKWLYFARLASLTGSQILFFALPLLIFKLTQNATYSGIAFSLEWTARIISFPLSGCYADRFGSKLVYIVSDLIISLFCATAILLINFLHVSVVVTLTCLGICAGFLSEQGYVSAETLAPKLINPNLYSKSQSILEMLELISLLFGPTLAGVFILYFRIDNLLWVSMTFYLISALMMNKVNAASYKIRVEIKFIQNLKVGFSTIYKSNYLINLVILSMIANMLFGLMTGSAPIMVIGIYGEPDRSYALLNLTAGIFGLVFIISFNHLLKYFNIIQIGISAFIISCACCMLLGISRNYFSYFFIYAVFYAVNSLFSIFFRSERTRIIPKDLLGRTIGSIIFITFSLFPLSGLLISLSQNLFNLQFLIMLFGFICLILGLISIKKIHQFGTESIELYHEAPISNEAQR